MNPPPGTTGHPNPWPACGWQDLARTEQGWHVAQPAWWARWLQRPELAPPEEACAAERALHDRLRSQPLRAVAPRELSAIADADARENWQHWLRFRDAVQAAGSLERWYAQLMRAGQVNLPPLFIDLSVQCILRGLLDPSDDAFEWRAAELLFRTQRISRQDAAVLAGDRDTLDMLNESGGFGELGRLLAQAQAPLRSRDLQVLTPQSAASYWASACAANARFDTLLDLRHHITQELGHGLQFKLDKAQSGLKGLSQVLQRWVLHLMGVRVKIRPEPRIDDERWRWHLGLDAQATALLNDLYAGREVDEARRRNLISLFRLDFEEPADMRADLRHDGPTPVYLGLAMTGDGLLRLKPQNLLLNLPLAQA